MWSTEGIAAPLARRKSGISDHSAAATGSSSSIRRSAATASTREPPPPKMSGTSERHRLARARLALRRPHHDDRVRLAVRARHEAQVRARQVDLRVELLAVGQRELRTAHQAAERRLQRRRPHRVLLGLAHHEALQRRREVLRAHAHVSKHVCCH